MRTARFHGDARGELVNQIRYYASISNLLGERFAKEVEDAIALATEFPEVGSPHSFGTRRVFPKRFPFSVVYAVIQTEIVILAIAPAKRKPGYWRHRVADFP
ncbi:MAG: type II toxin-antitoxin system RelE/ParE family toxin [Chloroflexota bacterium]